jgi:hypothetical protein
MTKEKRQSMGQEDDLIKRARVTHYTAREAYTYLGLNRDTFNNFVRRDPDGFGRVELFGERGYYRKDRIQAKKERFEAMLLAASTDNFEFRVATIDDLDAEDHMAYLNFGDASISPERKAARRKYLEINPLSSFHLYNAGTLVAFMNLIPLNHNAILEFRKGKRGWMFPDDAIKQFEPGERLECIIIDMATITNAPPERRDRYAAYLMADFCKSQLLDWGHQGIDIKSIDACGGTEEGKKILRKAEFTHLGTFKTESIGKPDVLVDRDMYHLDIDQADLSLLRRYKQALRERKQSH